MDHGIHRLSTRGKVKITDYHTSETSVSAPKITLLEPRVNKYPRQIFNGIQRIQGGPVKKKTLNVQITRIEVELNLNKIREKEKMALGFMILGTQDYNKKSQLIINK